MYHPLKLPNHRLPTTYTERHPQQNPKALSPQPRPAGVVQAAASCGQDLQVLCTTGTLIGPMGRHGHGHGHGHSTRTRTYSPTSRASRYPGQLDTSIMKKPRRAENVERNMLFETKTKSDTFGSYPKKPRQIHTNTKPGHVGQQAPKLMNP